MSRPLDELNKKLSAPPDAWAKLLHWLGLAGWTALVASFYFFGMAKPALETFFDRRHHVFVRKLWDMELVGYCLLLLGLSLVIGVAGVGINLWRQQEKQAEIRYNLLLLTFISFCGLFAGLWLFRTV